MKTAISVPDETFARAERRAAELGMTRSEFYARAAARYLNHLEAEALVDQIDDAVQVIGTEESSEDAVAAGRARLADDDSW